MLKSIYLKGYKNFEEETEINYFGKITLITGKSAVGKSNFINGFKDIYNFSKDKGVINNNSKSCNIIVNIDDKEFELNHYTDRETTFKSSINENWVRDFGIDSDITILPVKEIKSSISICSAFSNDKMLKLKEVFNKIYTNHELI